MSPWTAIGRSLGWGACTVIFGLVPLLISILIPLVDHDIPFSKTEFLKSGGIVIFAITITIAVLVDHYLSRFRFQSPSIGLMFNILVPFSICLLGMIIHITTVIAKADSLGIRFVFNANLGLAVLAVVFCLIQKALQVSADGSG
jgi:small basic protein